RRKKENKGKGKKEDVEEIELENIPIITGEENQPGELVENE
ncbi:13564_t:CDS:2, partial [Ambispora gerdemannii]